MTSLKVLGFGLAAALIVGGTLGCSGKKEQASLGSSSASSSNEDSDKAAMQKEIDRLKGEREADRLIDEGQRALRDGRYDDARKAFDDALKLDRDNRRAERGLDDVRDALKTAG